MSEPAIRLVWKKIDELIPYEHNAKLHPQEQLDKKEQSAGSGFNAPVEDWENEVNAEITIGGEK